MTDNCNFLHFDYALTVTHHDKLDLAWTRCL